MGRNNTHKKTAKATPKSCALAVGVLLGMSAFKSRSGYELNDLVDGLRTGLGTLQTLSSESYQLYSHTIPPIQNTFARMLPTLFPKRKYRSHRNNESRG